MEVEQALRAGFVDRRVGRRCHEGTKYFKGGGMMNARAGRARPASRAGPTSVKGCATSLITPTCCAPQQGATSLLEKIPKSLKSLDVSLLRPLVSHLLHRPSATRRRRAYKAPSV